MGDQVLVIGAGGFVGQHLTRALSSRGNKVIAVSRRPFDHDVTGVEAVVGAMTEPQPFAELLDRCHTVVYLASNSTPGTSSGRPVDEVRDNLLPLAALLQALQATPRVKLLYLSSGGSLYTASSADPSTEASPVQPRSYHGAAKVAAECLITAWCQQYEGHATLLRPSNIYGPGQLERPGFGIVPACFGKLMRGETLAVWGNGSIVRDYLYIDDFVALCTAILSSPMPAGAQVLNASSGAGVSLNELFHTVEKVTGTPLPRSHELDRPVDARQIVMDSTMARDRYGWVPATPLEEGLRKTWDWFNRTRH